VTVGRAFVADLEAVRSLLSHQIPDRNLAKVLHECVRRTLDQVLRRRKGSPRPGTVQPSADAAAPRRPEPRAARHIPAAVRDEVWRRDDGRCAFLAPDGRRCGSTYQVELHHLEPFAKGGASTVANVSLRCAGHHAHHTNEAYGPEKVARMIVSARNRAASQAEFPFDGSTVGPPPS